MAAYGTIRGDTVDACGDSNNGWGLSYNMSELGDGEHTVVAYADDEQFASSTFNVTMLSTGGFLTGATATTSITDFPSPGRRLRSNGNKRFKISSSLTSNSSDWRRCSSDGVAAAQYDAGIFAFDQALNYGACGGGPAPETGCDPSLSRL